MNRCPIVSLISTLFILLSGWPSSARTADSVALLTGQETGTYHAFGEDIAEQSTKHGQRVKLMTSQGSLDNIRQLMEGGGDIELGIVQSDVMSFLRRSKNKNTRTVAEKMALVFPLHEEEVHILARRNINGLRNLKGKRIVVGAKGSGSMLTAINILTLADISASELQYLSPAEGVVAVLSNKADAMVFVGGKPVPLFSNLATLAENKDKTQAELLEQVHLIPIDDQRIFEEYMPTRIKSSDYPFLDRTVLTAKVTASLVAYRDPDNAVDEHKCGGVRRVAGAIYRERDTLKTKGHPKWRQVNLFGEATIDRRDPCVWDGRRFIPAAQNKSSDDPNEALARELLDVVTKGKGKQTRE